MLIELIGCTSAGKSSLVRGILERNPAGMALVTSEHFALQQFHLGWVKARRLRTLLLNLIALLSCLLAWPQHRALIGFALGTLARLPGTIGISERLRIARITFRNIGVHEIVRRSRPHEAVVLADEGTLQIAHYLFVHVSVEPDLDGLRTFARLAPVPEVVVYLYQPEAVLVARTQARGHRRIPTGDPRLTERFIGRAQVVFDRLLEYTGLEKKLLTVSEGIVKEIVSESPQLALARRAIDSFLRTIPENAQESVAVGLQSLPGQAD